MANFIARLTSGITAFRAAGRPVSEVTAKTAYVQPAFASASASLADEESDSMTRAQATGSLPGHWMTDHYRETENFKSWSYIAIHTASKLAAAATHTVYLDDNTGHGIKALSPGEASKKETAQPDHHIVQLLDRPNPIFSGEVFKYQCEQQIRLTGSVLIWEVRNRAGNMPVQIWVIPHAWCRFMPGSPDHPMGVYRVQPVSTSMAALNYSLPTLSGFTIDARLIMRIGWPSPLYPGECTSSMSACGMIIDIADEIDTATYAGFQNAPQPSLHIDVDPATDFTPEREARLREQITIRQAGAVNFKRPLVTQGAIINPIGAANTDLDYVNGRAQSRDSCFGVQQVTPMAAGIVEASAFSAVVASLKQTTELSVQPNLNLVAGALTHRWRPLFGKSFRIQFDAKNYDDDTVKLSYTQAKASSGCYTVNEIRANFGDPPIEGGDAPPTALTQQAAPTVPGAANGPPDANAGPGPGDPDEFTDEPATDKITGIKRPDMAKSEGSKIALKKSYRGRHGKQRLDRGSTGLWQ